MTTKQPAKGVPPRFRLSSYRYRLPPERIAQVPAQERVKSRLLVLDRRGGIRSHARFEDLPQFLREGDCLVVNDTRVIPARIFARKETGGLVEVLMVRFEQERLYALTSTNRGLRPGALLTVLDRAGEETEVRLRVEEVDCGACFSISTPAGMSVQALLERHGRIPVPPYIRRENDSFEGLDRERYQTVYAREEGAVAAPTAGLHFDENLLAHLREKGIEIVPVTLHVGPGTFKPVRVEDIRNHRVDPERFAVGEETARAVTAAVESGRRVVAVGTTVVRVLETLGAKDGRVRATSGETSLTILPGHRFRVVSALITNFHLPESSLLVLVSAFAGRKTILRAYREAVREGYRFYSYGDAMLIV